MKLIVKLNPIVKRLPIWLTVGLALITSGLLTQLEAQDIEVEAMCGGRLSITWKPPPGAGGYQFTPAGEGGRACQMQRIRKQMHR